MARTQQEPEARGYADFSIILETENVMMPTLSALLAPGLVAMTTYDANSNNKVGRFTRLLQRSEYI